MNSNLPDLSLSRGKRDACARMPTVSCALALAVSTALAACGGGKDVGAELNATADHRVTGPVSVAASAAAPADVAADRIVVARVGQTSAAGAPPSAAPGSGLPPAAASSAVPPVATAPVSLPPPLPQPLTLTPPAVHGGIEVDLTSLPVPKPGISTLLVEQRALPAVPADPRAEGAVRLVCNWSKMGFDDPIVYPGQPGAAHHHTFFGNTAVDANTTVDNIRSKGNATCRGGIANMSAYWAPSVIDPTGKPVAPRWLQVYYKTGLWTYMGDRATNLIQPLPHGLRMIAGDASLKTPTGKGYFTCVMPDGNYRPGTKGSSIPACPAGDVMRSVLGFSQCWDGINLDSPDHKSHMADPERTYPDPYSPFRCPASHPVVIPLITFNIEYEVGAGVDSSKWRLASDMYDKSLPGGYSLHGDWMDGWDSAVSDVWGVTCLRAQRDCGSTNLGDGRQALEFQGN